MARREGEWNVIRRNGYFKSLRADERKHYKPFFLTGEEFRDKLVRTEAANRFAFTPYTTEAQARELFDLFVGDQMRALVLGYMETAAQILEGIPDRRGRIQLFSRGVLGDSFREMRGYRGREMILISPEHPEAYFERWCRSARRFLQGSEKGAGYDKCLDTIPYVFSMLDHLCRQKLEIPETFKQLHTVARDTDESSLSEWQREFRGNFLDRCASAELPEAAVRALE